MVKTYIAYPAAVWEKQSLSRTRRPVIREEPLSIRIQGEPYSVVLRTPGDEMAHVAGFCLGEGIIDTPDDYTTIAFCDGGDTNVVTVALSEARRQEIAGILDRRGYISQTSCGICGKELVDDLGLQLTPLPDGGATDAAVALACLLSIGDHQPLRRETAASHAAALFDAAGGLLSVAEDVGRHNALDKAIGRLFIEKRLDRAAFVALSSRISYELVQKAARARIPVVLGISRPTSLAVDLASRLNMTLGCLSEGDGLYLFCGERRLL